MLNKILFLYLILFTTSIKSNEIFPCNVTEEHQIQVQYETQTIQDGRIY
jgi:hypothetical protein